MYYNAMEPSKENEYDSIGGMMLLSYPSIESFVISNFEEDMYKFNERFDFEKHMSFLPEIQQNTVKRISILVEIYPLMTYTYKNYRLQECQ